MSANVYPAVWLTIHYSEKWKKYCHNVSKRAKSLGHTEKFKLAVNYRKLMLTNNSFDKTISPMEFVLDLKVSFNIWMIIV